MIHRWNTILILMILVCQIVLGTPNIRRAKRGDSNVVAAENSDLNQITYEVNDVFSIYYFLIIT
jgi:hypothetical protein